MELSEGSSPIYDGDSELSLSYTDRVQAHDQWAFGGISKDLLSHEVDACIANSPARTVPTPRLCRRFSIESTGYPKQENRGKIVKTGRIQGIPIDFLKRTKM